MNDREFSMDCVKGAVKIFTALAGAAVLTLGFSIFLRDTPFPELLCFFCSFIFVALGLDGIKFRVNVTRDKK